MHLKAVNVVKVANAFYGRVCAQFCNSHLNDVMRSFSESLNWKLATLGEDDPGQACIFYQMAHVHIEQSKPEEAITCCEEFQWFQKLDEQRNGQEETIQKLNGRQEVALFSSACNI